jgi:hypothetical protein
MPALTRRREKDRHQESWQVFFGDVRIGWIGERAGAPHDEDRWGWACGFHPRDRHVSGTAESFDHARAAFEAAWRDYLPTCTDDFEAYRRQQAWTRWTRCGIWVGRCRRRCQSCGRTASAALRSALPVKSMFTPATWKPREVGWFCRTPALSGKER